METSPSLIRELTPKEVQVNSRNSSQNFFKMVEIRTKIDLFANLNHLRSAIFTWKSMNKLLNAKVVKIDNKYCFVLNNEYLNSDSLRNVHFLRIQDKNARKSEPETVLRLLEEKCFFELIDFDKDHECLWRMVYIEIGKDNNDDYVYEIIWPMHHIIGDGRNANANVVCLLDIIQKTFRGEKVETKVFEVYSGTDKVFESQINSIQNRIKIPKILRPAFISPEKAKQSSFRSIPDQDEIDFDLVDVRSGRVFASYGQLLEISKNFNNLKPFCFILKQNFEAVHKS